MSRVEDDLRAQLAAAKEKLLEQQAFIEQISQPPFPIACVVQQGDYGVMINMGATDQIIQKPAKGKVETGDHVMLNPQTMQIMEKVEFVLRGTTATLARLLPSGLAEVNTEHSEKIVFVSPRVSELEPGNRVLLDASGSVIIQKLAEGASQYSRKETLVSWDDVGGHEEAKLLLKEALEYPYIHAKMYSHYGKTPPKGILFYGPPGCGKTMLGKASATAIAKLHGATNDGFMYIKTPELLSSYVGETEREIRACFARAVAHKAKHGYPAVLFFDEADALMNRRGHGISTDIDRAIVPTFLTEMDGLDESAAIVIIATNRPDTLDEAITREGRIDHKIEIKRPGQLDAQEIFKLNLSKVPLYGSETPKSLAKSAAEYIFTTQGLETVVAGLSGAMVANIVTRSTSYALRRDMAANRKSGIKSDDITTSIMDICTELTALSRSATLRQRPAKTGATW